MSRKMDVDIAIVGGGLVGTTMALALAKGPHRVALIDAMEPTFPTQPSASDKQIVIHQQSQQALASLGVWSMLTPYQIHETKVYDSANDNWLVLTRETLGLPQLASVVSGQQLGKALQQALLESHVQRFVPQRITHISLDNHGVTLVREGHEPLHPGFLILADGTDSPFKASLGFHTLGQDYPSDILVTTLTLDTPHRHQAFELATSLGPLALIPKTAETFSCIWTLPKATLTTYLALDDAALMETLQSHLPKALGKIEAVGPRKQYPAKWRWVKSPIMSPVAVVGNAAHTVHPFGAQGFNLGLRDCFQLSAMLNGQDLASPIPDSLISSFVDDRKRDSQATLYFSDSGLRLFQWQHPVFTTMRKWIFTGFQHSLTAKQQLLKKTLHTEKLPQQQPPPSQQKKTDYDIIIIGAGLTGSAMALALANSDLRIAIIDKQLPKPFPSGAFDMRINAYNLASERCLRNLGVWEHLPEDRRFPFTQVQVCAETNASTLTFDADQEPGYFGHFMENILVIDTMQAEIQHYPNIQPLMGKTVNAMIPETDKIWIQLDEDMVSAKVCLACDGPNSTIRSLAGFATQVLPYEQQCIVGTITFDGDHQHCAWQRFLTTGPLGLLPLQPGFCSLAWSLENAKAKKQLALDDDMFLAELQSATEGRLGRITHVGKRASYPLVAKMTKDYIQPRLALIGDAAHSVHPLAGLGANLGFQDVASLAKILLAAQQRGQDVGSHELLRQYQRERQYHNELVSHGLSLINHIFRQQHVINRGLASLLLRSANASSLLQAVLKQQAMWLTNH